MIDRLDPHLEFEGAKEDLIHHFEELIHATWAMLGQDYFDGLISSMGRRVEAVIAANRWYTKY